LPPASTSDKLQITQKDKKPNHINRANAEKLQAELKGVDSLVVKADLTETGRSRKSHQPFQGTLKRLLLEDIFKKVSRVFPP